MMARTIFDPRTKSFFCVDHRDWVSQRVTRGVHATVVSASSHLHSCAFFRLPSPGKTTLAHILAKQAGYHPYEINASDDRNPAVLESKIRAATEMQSVSFGVSHTARPNCVILDEIDGVGQEAGEMGAIAMLLKIVQAEGRKSAKKKDEEAEGEDSGGSDEDADTPLVIKRKSKRSDGPKVSPLGPLKRPIICICNDQYAAALRPLRAVARIFEFTAAPKSKFVDRLKYIAGREGMEYDPRTLGALADVVDMDIRSALNTLQFVHNKGQKSDTRTTRP
jgi:chromosome transmission fidelity protein 18